MKASTLEKTKLQRLWRVESVFFSRRLKKRLLDHGIGDVLMERAVVGEVEIMAPITGPTQSRRRAPGQLFYAKAAL
ncbi:hypothetical protein V5T82_14610 [Magnetovibrio sp. PR-2]|uniref:hypothetical protein n=1 Tax=Magnetovibrio sp. PR-2 TaxID=3120356 RepID=UPI002FCE43CC